MSTAAGGGGGTSTMPTTSPVVLQSSLSQTYHALMEDDPETVEQDQIQRAMELSLLDCALVIRPSPTSSSSTTTALTEARSTTGISHTASPTEDPYRILGLSSSVPTLTDIKAAYRHCARQTHPDRTGGNEAAFQQVARAYRTVLQHYQQQNHTSSVDSYYHYSDSPKQLKGTAHWDKELANHQRLVQELFAGSTQVLRERQTLQQNVLKHVLCLQICNAGSVNMDEQDQILYNSCFYLSLAASYLAGIGALLDDEEEGHDAQHSSSPYDDKEPGIASSFGTEDRYLIGETALHLKRTIEAAVLKAHPEWALQGKIGDHVQAFSDFLVYLLDQDPTETVVSEWAVVVFDTTSGVADVYKGQYYNEDERPETAASHCLTLRYIPGHYEALLPASSQHPRPTLSQILQVLDANEIFYVVTES